MARQLTEGVWLLDLGLVPPLASNAYLVDDELFGADGTERAGGPDGGTDERVSGDPVPTDELTLIDTGLFWNLRSIRDELTEAGYALADVDRVLLTHYDLDHTGGLRSIRGEFAGPVHLGEADARLVAGEDHPNVFHHKGLFHRIARGLFPLPEGLDVARVADGDRIGRFRAYHTPGHNPGHTVYVHDGGAAFLGDLVWEEEGELTPPFWLDSYDMRQVSESIRRFADRSPEFELACMGHGTPMVEGGSSALDRLVAGL